MEPSERTRLSKQCLAILALLESGQPVTNVRLAQVALKYTSRVSDLRAKGHNIRVVSREPNGLTWYRLLPAVPPHQMDLWGAA